MSMQLEKSPTTGDDVGTGVPDAGQQSRSQV